MGPQDETGVAVVWGRFRRAAALALGLTAGAAATSGSALRRTEGAARAAVTDGLLAHYPMDDPPGSRAVADASGNGHTARLSGGVGAETCRAEGRFGRALRLDGVDDWVELPASLGLGSGAGSVSLWLRTEADYREPGHLLYGSPEAHGDGFGDQRELHLHVHKRTKLGLFIRGNVTVGSRRKCSDGEWHHAVAAWDKAADRVALYLDGSLEKSSEHKGWDFPLGKFLRLGAPAVGKRLFAGELDEVRLYGRALTDEEARALFTTGPTSVPRGSGTYHLQPGDVVLLMGDGVTAAGYHRFLREDIAGEYPALARGGGAVRFVNAGKAGETTSEALSRARALVAARRPTAAVVEYGLSDVVKGPQGCAARVMSLVAALRARAVSVTLLTPPALYTKGRPELEPLAPVLEGMVEELRGLARREGLPLADCHAAMTEHYASGGEDLSWGDGIHPNERGLRMIADALQEAWGFGKPLAETPSPGGE
jgi:lysophospholipase L1-like esterase